MEADTHARMRLMQAGYMRPSAVASYYTIRLVLAFGLPTLFVLIGPMISQKMEMEAVVWSAGALAILGFYIPVYLVLRKISARQLAVREGFPDALDMLLVCVEAGLSLDAAINRVSTEIEKAHPIIAAQFGLVGLELRAGKTREDALRHLSDRVGIDEVSSLVTLLVQSDAMGTSIAQALRVHADELRVNRMLRA